jgi:DNA-binding IclR family transcriptional regulator
MPAIHTQSVPALDRALTLLELLGRSKAGLTLPELVVQTGLPKSSVHCLLVTLQRRGYLYRNERTSRYLFGMKLLSLANSAISGMKLRDQAMSFLRGLMNETGLTTHLAILENQEAVLVSKCEPSGIVRLATWIGKRMDVHCTSLGKALIAYCPSEELDRIIKEHGLPRHNDNTICSRKKLKEELQRVVERGYAVDDEEDELGLRCIGAPVFNLDGQVIASISLAGTTAQVTAENVPMLAARLIETAMALSQSLAHDLSAEPDSVYWMPAVQSRHAVR